MPIRRISADISELFAGAEKLVLDADAGAGDSTLTVKSIIGAAINNILCLREPGSEHAEIIATHAATAPSGNTVTLVSALVESHPRGTTVYIIPANTVRFYYAAAEVDANSDDSTLTALAAAQNIDPTEIRNFYNDTTQTSGYYYWRFIDSINSVNLTYHGPIPWGTFTVQYSDNEVGYLLEFVRRKLGREWDERFSKQTAMDEINACLRFIQGKLKHWSRYLVPDYVLGQTARGVYDYALPSNIYDNETNKSILQVRLSRAIDPLVMLDEKQFDQLLEDVAHTQVRTQATAGAVTLEIDNSYDFDSSGTVNIYTSNVADAITYTGVTRSATAGVLTGVPASGAGAIGATHVVDTNVWQGESEGQPHYANVRNGRLRIWPLPNSAWVNYNLLLDYYQEVTKVDSEDDTIDAPRYDMVKEWLLWKGDSYWRNNGKDDSENANLGMFQTILKDAIRTEVSGQRFKMKPKINTVNYHPDSRDTRFDYT